MAYLRLLALPALVAAGLTFAPVAAEAHHVDGPYSGTTATGGSIDFEVHGSQIANLGGNADPSCQELGYSDPFPISLATADHPFSYSYINSPAGISIIFNGHFPVAGKAEGTISDINPLLGCAAGPLSWTASTGGEDGGGNRPGPAARKKCKKIKNKARRKKCLKKQKGGTKPPTRR